MCECTAHPLYKLILCKSAFGRSRNSAMSVKCWATLIFNWISVVIISQVIVSRSWIVSERRWTVCFLLSARFFCYLYPYIISVSISVWGRRIGWTAGRCTSGIKNPLRELRPTSLSVTPTTALSPPRWANHSPWVSATTLFIITLLLCFVFRQPCNPYCGHVF